MLINMEENSSNDLSLTMSGWKLKQQTLKNLRNNRQLQNRLIILQLERQNKVKAIQKKLENHKKLMQIRMDRHRHKQSIDNKDKSIENEASNNSIIFRDIRTNRAANIRSRSNQMRQTNNHLFRQIKMKRQENQKIIRQQSQQELGVKMRKRNRVRMIQIQCKENVNQFWAKRLDSFKDRKEREIARNIQFEEKNIESLIKLQRSQANLLSEIKRTQQMESQLMSMMAEEKSVLNATICPKE